MGGGNVFPKDSNGARPSWSGSHLVVTCGDLPTCMRSCWGQMSEWLFAKSLGALVALHASTKPRIGRLQMKRMALWILPVLVFSSIVSFAQSTNAGDIRGTITDTSGAVVP